MLVRRASWLEGSEILNIKARVPVDVDVAAAFVYCMALSGLELFCVCSYCCSTAIGHAYPAIAYMNLLFTKVLICDIRLCTSQLHEGQKTGYKCCDKIHQLAVSDGEGKKETDWSSSRAAGEVKPSGSPTTAVRSINQSMSNLP